MLIILWGLAGRSGAKPFTSATSQHQIPGRHWMCRNVQIVPSQTRNVDSGSLKLAALAADKPKITHSILVRTSVWPYEWSLSASLTALIVLIILTISHLLNALWPWEWTWFTRGKLYCVCEAEPWTKDQNTIRMFCNCNIDSDQDYSTVTGVSKVINYFLHIENNE